MAALYDRVPELVSGRMTVTAVATVLMALAAFQLAFAGHLLPHVAMQSTGDAVHVTLSLNDSDRDD
jgi:hypothetical protein